MSSGSLSALNSPVFAAGGLVGLGFAAPPGAFGSGGGSLWLAEEAGAPMLRVGDGAAEGVAGARLGSSSSDLVAAGFIGGGETAAGLAVGGTGKGGKDGEAGVASGSTEAGFGPDGRAGGTAAAAPSPCASVMLCDWILTAPDPAADFCS
jgi:hypothetical protein